MSYVYAFEEGSKEQKFLLGGKGANLAEMTKLGLPVPPGFTITHRRVPGLHGRRRQRIPDGLMDEVAAALAALEAKMGKKLGDATDPLLVSVRSGAAFSMPGMMDTVLNLGLNDVSVGGWPSRPTTRASPTTRTAASSRCSPRSCSTSTATKFEHALEQLRSRARASPPTPELSRRRPQGPGRPRSRPS